ncbi:hypothetical protein ACOMHN_029817 [Nucella lapillus]
MAPPQVDFSKKVEQQPLEDVNGWAVVVGDKKLPPLPPSAPVPVESGTTVAGKRGLGKRRCKKLIIGIIIGAVVATAITVGVFMAHRHHHGDHWKGHVKDRDGHHAEEHVRLEGSRRLIHIARNATNHFFGLLAVLDYKTQLAGFKDCNKKVCYVDRLRESYEGGCERWRHYKRHGRMMNKRPLRVGPMIDKHVLQYIAGEPIFKVCGSLPSYWVLEATPQDHQNKTTQIIYL